MTRCLVVCKNHDASSNAFGRSNQKPILETHLYEVEFPGEEITELAANIIEESMYAQCNVDGNEYLLLQAVVDQRNNGSALSIEDLKVVFRG